jgi:hypothetical protein
MEGAKELSWAGEAELWRRMCITSKRGYIFNGRVDYLRKQSYDLFETNIRTAAYHLGLRSPFTVNNSLINKIYLQTTLPAFNFKQNQIVTMAGTVRMEKNVPTEQWAQVVEKTGQR